MEAFKGLRVLIADDNVSDRLILEAILKKQEHVVLSAIDGVEAVEIFRHEQPDIVLLDALMPNMDGFEAAKQIKSLAAENLVPIIFLTSLTDATALADCLEAGGDDFLSKPYNRIILHAKIQAFARMRRLNETVMVQRDEISIHMDRLIREQEVAKVVFDNIAHPGCINAKNIKYLLSPMAVFNGDMALAARKPSGGMYVLLGDFTGHGLPAAIGAMPASEIFYGMTLKGFSIQEILKEINKKLNNILPTGVFCCCCMVDISFRKKRARLWVGGLPDIFIYRPSNKTITRVKSRHLPLGVLSSEKFITNIDVYEMEYGDKIFLWSDGIHEAMNTEGEMFGDERLLEVFENNQCSDDLFDEIITGVDAFTGAKDQDDDHTLVEVAIVSPDALEDTSDLSGNISSQGPIMDWKFTYELRPDSLRTFNPLPLLTHLLMEVPGLKPHSGHLYTILAELYSNSLEHGLLGLSSDLKGSSSGFSQYYQLREEKLKQLKDKKITFILNHCPTDTGGCLTITVIDEGEGFKHNTNTSNGHKNVGYCGRGIPLIQTLCSSIDYFGAGNHVEVKFPWAYINSKQ